MNGPMNGMRPSPHTDPNNSRKPTTNQGRLPSVKTTASTRRTRRARAGLAGSGRRSRKYRYSSAWGAMNKSR